jgi:hypothetical protein
VPKNKEKESDAAFLARMARLRKELAKPQLTKSEREMAAKKQLASWNTS